MVSKKNKKKIILFVTGGLLENWGGGEKWIFNVVGYLKRTSNYDIIIASPFFYQKLRNKKIRLLLRKIGIEYKIILYKLKYRSFVEILPNFLFLKLLFVSDYIYITNIIEMVLVTLLSALLGKKRVIVGNHGTFFTRGKAETLKLKFLKMLRSLLGKRVIIHAINPYHYLFFKKIGYKYVFLIPNFVDCKHIVINSKQKDFVVLFMSRLDKTKGVQYLPYIVEKTLKRNPNIKFWIIGSGERELENLIQSLEKKYNKNVKWFGFVSEDLKHKLLSQATIFLNLSLAESGYPTLSIGEALCYGLPVVSLNVKPINILLRKFQIFGKIAKDIGDISNKILEYYELWKSTEWIILRRKITETFIKNFSKEKILEKIRKLF